MLKKSDHHRCHESQEALSVALTSASGREGGLWKRHNRVINVGEPGCGWQEEEGDHSSHL